MTQVADPVRGAGCIKDKATGEKATDVADPVRGAGCIRVDHRRLARVLGVADPVRGAGCISGEGGNRHLFLCCRPREGSGLYQDFSLPADRTDDRCRPREGSGLYRAEQPNLSPGTSRCRPREGSGLYRGLLNHLT